jgi:hypothetical protein
MRGRSCPPVCSFRLALLLDGLSVDLDARSIADLARRAAEPGRDDIEIRLRKQADRVAHTACRESCHRWLLGPFSFRLGAFKKRSKDIGQGCHATYANSLCLVSPAGNGESRWTAFVGLLSKDMG